MAPAALRAAMAVLAAAAALQGSAARPDAAWIVGPRAAVPVRRARARSRAAASRAGHARPPVLLAAAAGGAGAAEGAAGGLAARLAERGPTLLTNLFPVWTVGATAWGLRHPASMAWFGPSMFKVALSALMLSMGVTLSTNDFLRALDRPKAAALQLTMCYTVMPLLAYGLGAAFSLPSATIAGLVLVGSMNGGLSSNLCTYIARGNVALSVVMTTVTTLCASVFAPLLCKLLVGAMLPIDVLAIAKSTLQFSLAPIALGVVLNTNFPETIERAKPLCPVVGVAATCLLVASSVAQCAPAIVSAGLGLQVPVFLLHALGAAVGYWVPKLSGFGEIASRTISIETCMKSSAFAYLLASLHFPSVAARVPAAMSTVYVALIGSGMGVAWRYKPLPEVPFNPILRDRIQRRCPGDKCSTEKS